MQSIVVVTAPTVEPVSLTEAKAHLRVNWDDDDTYIESLISVARLKVEEVTWRALVTQTVRMNLDAFPASSVIEVPRPPLQSITSITYKLVDGSEETVSSDDYVVDTDSEPGRISLVSGATWPSDTLYPLAGVSITYVAGWEIVESVASTPKPIKQAILLMIGHLYENREDVVIAMGVNIATLPRGADSLIHNYRMRPM